MITFMGLYFMLQNCQRKLEEQICKDKADSYMNNVKSVLFRIIVILGNLIFPNIDWTPLALSASGGLLTVRLGEFRASMSLLE